MDIQIKPAKIDDLELLNKYLPVDIPDFHLKKITDQNTNDSVWLIAWLDGKPIARGQLQWKGSNRENVKAFLPDTPQIDSLDVLEEFQGKGVGTKMIQEMERMANERRIKRIGMAVEIENEGASRLYERLGYKNWGNGDFDGSWDYTDGYGVKHHVKETYTYMVKELA